MTRGVAILTNNTSTDGIGVERLLGYGIDRIDVIDLAQKSSSENVAVKFAELIDTLQPGDRLVMCSLFDVCRSVDGLFELLHLSLSRGFLLVSLEEEWLEACGAHLANGRTQAFLEGIRRGISETLLYQHGDILRKVAGRKSDLRNMRKYKKGGRPKGSIKMNDQKLELAVQMYCKGEYSVKEICDIVQCNERTMYRYLKLKGVAGRRKSTGVKIMQRD